MSETATKKLFQPIRVGNVQLSHRIVLAPLTRTRADDAHVPTPTMVEYYAQRASVPGTLLLAEGTFIAAKAGGLNNAPGIWSDAQIEGWKKVADAVHAQGSYIYMQLYANGRAPDPHVLFSPDSPIHAQGSYIYMQLYANGRAPDPHVLFSPDSPSNPGGPYPFVAPSPIPLSTSDQSIVPRELTHEEILEYIELFGQAAYNAVYRAGFDGVEIHCAHGYLIEQFIDDRANRRTDQWGGSIDNRIRFPLEVIKKVVSVVGEERTGFRLSPFSTFQDMRMDHPYPTFAALTARVREAYPRLAYLHVVEPRIAGAVDRVALEGESNNFLRSIWKAPDSLKNGSVYLSAGGYNPETAIEHAGKGDELVVFGRYFISNPDLPARIKKGIPLTPYVRSKFYTGAHEGYTDYPFADPETEARYNSIRKY
ncbi:NADH:flavin oxidoreductase/NADH oxidase [Sanghuangporus baumii]|uniref:NADH:flavin oxidoreductase/NADH oxidase n=1 Tax=Sanghuangporus baumii TaxID=108892 RepID=A0A9Q5I3U0_SANBA|nr:NADH:flavin oxidoreductase/NADH oxidase [Sanghuangporus baumii]